MLNTRKSIDCNKAPDSSETSWENNLSEFNIAWVWLQTGLNFVAFSDWWQCLFWFFFFFNKLDYKTQPCLRALIRQVLWTPKWAFSLTLWSCNQRKRPKELLSISIILNLTNILLQYSPQSKFYLLTYFRIHKNKQTLQSTACLRPVYATSSSSLKASEVLLLH